MELKDLKSAWNKYSSIEVDKHHLAKENIHELLKSKTKTLVERIDRNMKIGMGVLLVFIAYVLIDDLYLSKVLIDEPVQLPFWMIPLDAFSNVIIVTTYLFFVLRYIKIKRSFSIDLQLKDLLIGIKKTLITYRRMFYLAVVILLINAVVSFAAGVYQGLKLKAGNVDGGIENIATSKILSVTGMGLLVMVPVVALIFFLLRWGFNKLYGRYLVKLSDTLRELEETKEPE